MIEQFCDAIFNIINQGTSLHITTYEKITQFKLSVLVYCKIVQ